MLQHVLELGDQVPRIPALGLKHPSPLVECPQFAYASHDNYKEVCMSDTCSVVTVATLEVPIADGGYTRYQGWIMFLDEESKPHRVKCK